MPNDPTIQSPMNQEAAITASLAEIEAMGRKAARGAGYSWGLAEEAGRGARWLASYGLPGATCLAPVLGAVAEDLPAHQPAFLGGVWQAEKALCPIHLGAVLSDRAETLKTPVLAGPVLAGPVLCPSLLLPPLCWSAQALGGAFEVRVGAQRLIARAEGPVILRASQAVDSVEIRWIAPEGEPLAAKTPTEQIDGPVWALLGRLAHRTYVPATEASRQGAGAGALDND